MSEKMVRPNLSQQQIDSMDARQCLMRQVDLRVYVDIEKTMSVERGQDECKLLDKRIEELRQCSG
jgi:hypothetical protein